jgi:hypothetical protein
MLLHIKSINPQKMTLDDNSEWQPLPGLGFSLLWKVGDEVISEKKEGKFSLHRLSNKTRKEEIGAIPIKTREISKSLGKEDANLNMEIKIKDTSDELIWLEDGSKWQMYPPTAGDPGPWDIGDVVIVIRGVSKSMSKIYQMKNVKTGIALMAVLLGCER